MPEYSRKLTVKRASDSNMRHLLIFEGNERVGELRSVEGFFELIDANGEKFRITQRVDGAVVPFSAKVLRNGEIVLKMRDAFFIFAGKLYSFWNAPEGESLVSRHGPRRFITRLDAYNSIEPWSLERAEQRNLKRSRGAKVGEISGYSTVGHTVGLTDRSLDPIAVPLAAISCLFFSGV
jgi:hypothetical protein